MKSGLVHLSKECWKCNEFSVIFFQGLECKMCVDIIQIDICISRFTSVIIHQLREVEAMTLKHTTMCVFVGNIYKLGKF